MSGSPEVLEVGGARPLVGAVDVPGDKSISHRALLLSALAEGTSGITGLSGGDDVTRTRHAVEALGAIVADDGALVTVEGGRSRLSAPASTSPRHHAADRRRLAPLPTHGPGGRPVGPHGRHGGGGG
jgi:5-enolpyruvylshikimate-3-phosphate synthase